MKLNELTIYGATIASSILIFWGYVRDGYTMKLSFSLTVLTWLEPVVFGIMAVLVSYAIANRKNRKK